MNYHHTVQDGGIAYPRSLYPRPWPAPVSMRSPPIMFAHWHSCVFSAPPSIQGTVFMRLIERVQRLQELCVKMVAARVPV